MSENTLQIVEKLVNYTSLKQKVISKNISNITTENYRREDVNFEDFLRLEAGGTLRTTKEKHFDIGGDNESAEVMSVSKDNSEDMKTGFNNIDVEKEMAELAENQIIFKFGLKKISSYFRNVQSAIRGQ